MLAAARFDFEIPTLETERLRLRGHTLEDFPSCCALWADAEVTRYIGGRPLSAEETWSRLLRHLGHWGWLGFGSWCVEEKETGNFVGEVGLFDYRRELQPPLGDLPELGWALAPRMSRKGYATEAVTAALRWAARRGLDARGIACLIHPDNAASLRVAQKCGFEARHSTVYKGSPATVLVQRA
jgi:RimJ/RimL family protein N-acetyltransferase